MNKINMIGCVSALALLPAIAGAQDADHPTYANEVSRIIQENCQICHQPGQVGPMSFTSYEEVRPWAPLIRLKVLEREMPPYQYDQGTGTQDREGDWRLEKEEIDTIVAWVNQGSPMGDADVVVPMPELNDPSEWNFVAQFGQPDKIIPSISIDIPANGNDLWSNHYVPSGMTTDRCIKAVQVKPRGDAKAVVHHANSSVVLEQPDGSMERQSMLTEYAMGKWGEIVPEGVCRTLPKDAVVSWSIHMFPGGVGATAPGTMIEDNVVEIGLWFHPEGYEEEAKDKQHLSRHQISPQEHLATPPTWLLHDTGISLLRSPGSHRQLPAPWPPAHECCLAGDLLPGNWPHRSRSAKSRNGALPGITATSTTQDAAPLLPAGAVLVLKQWYDNTADNPNNPDPAQWVMGGSRTGDEMTHAWIAVTHLDDDGFEKLVAERKAKEQRAVAGND